jgi:hypothetical protein
VTNRIAPPQRPSGHTVVGLGAVEARNGNGHRDREESPTPPSGIDLDTLGQMGLEAGVMYLGEQLRRMADEEHRSHSVIARAAAHAELAETSADRAVERLRELQGDVDTMRAAMLGEVIPALERQSKALARIVELQAAVVALDTRLGQPPTKLDQRSSQVGELTAAELTELEQGTGLAGVVGRLVAGQARLAKRVGIGAGVAAAAAPVAIEVVKYLFGGG